MNRFADILCCGFWRTSSNILWWWPGELCLWSLSCPRCGGLFCWCG